MQSRWSCGGLTPLRQTTARLAETYESNNVPEPFFAPNLFPAPSFGPFARPSDLCVALRTSCSVGEVGRRNSARRMGPIDEIVGSGAAKAVRAASSDRATRGLSIFRASREGGSRGSICGRRRVVRRR